MRDIVEIGIGREARRTYELDDIALVPTRRTPVVQGRRYLLAN